MKIILSLPRLFIVTLLLTTLILCTNANAQQQKPTQSQSRLVAQYIMEHDGGTYQPINDSAHYYFSGNEHYDLTKQICFQYGSLPDLDQTPGHLDLEYPDSAYLYHLDNGTYSTLNVKELITFDASGRMLSMILLGKNPTTLQWENSLKVNYTYSGNNANPTTTVSQTGDGNNWLNSGRSTFSYNSGNQTKEIRETWDNPSSSWVKTKQFIKTYDAAGNNTSWLLQYWNSSWENYSKVIYTYDINNNEVLSLASDWNSSINDWVYSVRIESTFNALNLETEWIKETWNSSSDSWKKYSRIVTTYDANGSPLDRINLSWTSSSWLNSKKYIYTFNSEGMLENTILQEWFPTSTNWQNSAKISFAYNDYNQVTEITEESASGSIFEGTIGDNKYRYFYENFDDGATGIEELGSSLGFTIYPNPADQQIKIHIPIGGIHHVKIIDINGKIVFESKVKINANEIVLPTSQLNAGVYFLQTIVGHQILNRKFIIKH